MKMARAVPRLLMLVEFLTTCTNTFRDESIRAEKRAPTVPPYRWQTRSRDYYIRATDGGVDVPSCQEARVMRNATILNRQRVRTEKWSLGRNGVGGVPGGEIDETAWDAWTVGPWAKGAAFVELDEVEKDEVFYPVELDGENLAPCWGTRCDCIVRACFCEDGRLGSAVMLEFLRRRCFGHQLAEAMSEWKIQPFIHERRPVPTCVEFSVNRWGQMQIHPSVGAPEVVHEVVVEPVTADM